METSQDVKGSLPRVERTAQPEIDIKESIHRSGGYDLPTVEARDPNTSSPWHLTHASRDDSAPRAEVIIVR